MVQIQDSTNVPTHVQRDGLGRTVGIIDKSPAHTSYTYGPFGLVHKVTAPDNT